MQAALALSPLDPFRYGMLGVLAFNCLWAGDYPGAARWASEAASAPGAHALIALIATACLDIAGERDAAGRWAGRARMRHPEVSAALFFKAFPFDDHELRARIEARLRRYGF